MLWEGMLAKGFSVKNNFRSRRIIRGRIVEQETACKLIFSAVGRKPR